MHIDRSEPLPIHEFPKSLIEIVARLRELEANDDRPWRYTDQGDNARIWGPDGDEVATVWDNMGMDISSEHRAKVIVSLQNAAPALLGILGEIQEGDADVLKNVADDREQMAKFIAGFGKPDTRITDVLRRYQAMAARMEGNP